MTPVTIDPEDNRVMEWLAKALGSSASSARVALGVLADASRSPVEPEGPGAAVVDGSKRTWVSVDTRKQRWVSGNFNGGHEHRDWLDLWHPVTVLREGYTPEAKS